MSKLGKLICAIIGCSQFQKGDGYYFECIRCKKHQFMVPKSSIKKKKETKQ